MRVLSGVQPSGKLHVGNWFGAIRQFLHLQQTPGNECFYFIADLHAMNSVHDGNELRANSLLLATDFLALGLDPQPSVLYRQSDVPEVTELTWMLSTVTPMGLLQRGHSYSCTHEFTASSFKPAGCRCANSETTSGGARA